MKKLDFILQLAETYKMLAIETGEIHYMRKSKLLYREALKITCLEDVA